MSTTTTTTADTTADTTTTTTAPAPLAPKVLADLQAAATAVNGAESTTAKAVRAAAAKGFGSTCDAYVSLGNALKPVVAAMGETMDDVSGNAILKYLQSVVPAESYGDLPTAAFKLIKAVQIVKWDTADRRKDYAKTDNAPDADVYAPWLQATATGKFGNRSKYDVKASLADPTDWDTTANDGKGGVKPGAKFGTLVVKSIGRGAGTGGDGADSTGIKVPDALRKVLKMDRAKLTAVPVVSQAVVPDDKLEGFVLQMVARYLLAENADKSGIDITF